MHPAPPLPVPHRQVVQFLLLIAAATAAAYARTTVGPLQESMRVALALTDHQVALLQGPALALPVVLGAVPLGLLIDRYSRVRLLLAFAVLDVTGSLLTALAPGFATLFLARCVVGLMVTAISTTAFSLIADLCEPAQRGRASMLIVIGQFAGMAAAFALGGELVARAGVAGDAWRRAMLWLTAPLVIVALMMPMMREPARTGRTVENPSVRDSCVGLWRHRAVIAPALTGIVMAEVAVMALLTWAAPSLSRSFALGPDRVGAIVATGLTVSGVAGPVVGGVLADLSQRAGGAPRTMLVLSGLALLGAPAGLFAVAPDATSSGVLLAVFMTLVGAIVVAGTALFTIIVPNELRGLCIAVLAGLSALLGIGAAPVIVSLLSDATGGPASIGRSLTTVCVAAILLGAGAFALGARSVRYAGGPSERSRAAVAGSRRRGESPMSRSRSRG